MAAVHQTTDNRPRRRLGAQRGAFTLIELIVVITVIALILSIAVPAVSNMSAESRFTSAAQVINGIMTRAHYTADAEGAMVAVRFMPGEWDYNIEGDPQRQIGRQHLVNYRYVGSTDTIVNNQWNVQFQERFERREDAASTALPADIGVAPLEARSLEDLPLGGTYATGAGNLGQDVLTGRIGGFAANAEHGAGSAGGNYVSGNQFLSADDFLVVIDPQTGVRTGKPKAFPLKAYSPVATPPREIEAEGNVPMQRYAFSGIVLYRREPFKTLGNDAQGAVRQDWLRASGRPYLIHRFSGGLVMGSREGR